MFLRIPGTVCLVLMVALWPATIAAQEGPLESGQDIEIDLLISYYDQDGDHSAVTGGIGTEDQQVISPVILVRWQVNDDWSVRADVGLDNITSASVDNMDDVVSSASRNDTRAYTTFTGTRAIGGQNVTFGLGFSGEYDYTSISGGLGWFREFNKKNTSLSASIWHYDDTVELYDIDGVRRGEDSRTTLALSSNLTQILGANTVASIDVSASLQKGFLSTPFHEILLSPGGPSGQPVRTAERLPDARDRFAVGLRLNHAFSPRLVQKTYVRFYDDDWGISATTIELETHFRLPTKNETWIYPILRYHDQSASDFFGLPGSFLVGDEYYTADWDLGEFTSEKYGLGWKIIFPRNHSGWIHPRRFETRLTQYTREDGLEAISGSFSVGWRF